MIKNKVVKNGSNLAYKTEKKKILTTDFQPLKIICNFYSKV